MAACQGLSLYYYRLMEHRNTRPPGHQNQVVEGHLLHSSHKNCGSRLKPRAPDMCKSSPLRAGAQQRESELDALTAELSWGYRPTAEGNALLHCGSAFPSRAWVAPERPDLSASPEGTGPTWRSLSCTCSQGSCSSWGLLRNPGMEGMGTSSPAQERRA